MHRHGERKSGLLGFFGVVFSFFMLEYLYLPFAAGHDVPPPAEMI